MIYLDANIFIYAAINPEPIGDRCRKLLLKVKNKQLTACTSYLTWDEVVHSIWKKKNREISVKEGKNLLLFPELIWNKIDENTSTSAQNLITKYSLKPRDAIHAANALLYGEGNILSDDSDFDKIKELKRIKP